ncbi:ABC transporter ATP-binding protein [Roseitranquillus sediminis]|uniref:ABC transporter ATP-binding protein n=1 Tax=Roseitranquillus sediminis TaxID=2809051 RepID=UPI001D0C45BD|nr:ABC transporter ATP-binding protein [Roseitranquillus sediminis]MBM9595953.1 ABC transporter ATP-binding protein [Roseitranquillus sediminis]
MNQEASVGRAAPLAAKSEPQVVLDGVGKSFGTAARARTEVLRDMSLEVREGEFVSLLGPSGCGKTTVLRLVDGLLAPDAGRVTVFGGDPTPGPELGFVFQSFRLIPWFTVRGNVEFALAPTGLSRAEKRERAERYIELVGLRRFAEAHPHELSGGMSQRVALARALVTEPRVLLMDEPFASIDAQTRELMQAELMRLWSSSGATVLFVTHSVDEAILLSDRIALMGPRPGRVLENIEVEGLPRPRWSYDVRSRPEFVDLRRRLWERIRQLVLEDPESDFFGRGTSREAQ